MKWPLLLTESSSCATINSNSENDKEIIPTENDDGFKWYEGYDYCLSGSVILDFVDAAEKYSRLDVRTIREELAKKKVWYYETYKSGDD